MASLTISLPSPLKGFVDQQIEDQGYDTCSAYIGELIRRDQERLQLRRLLVAGGASKPAAPADGAYFAALRARIHEISA